MIERDGTLLTANIAHLGRTVGEVPFPVEWDSVGAGGYRRLPADRPMWEIGTVIRADVGRSANPSSTVGYRRATPW